MGSDEVDDLPEGSVRDIRVDSQVIDLPSRAEGEEDEGYDEEDVDKFIGAQRFTAVFACDERLSGRVKLQYYFESFGELTLPAE